MNHQIRIATEKDIQRIVELEGFLAEHHHKIDPYWATATETAEQFRIFLIENIKSPESLWLVVDIGSEIVGYFSAKISKKDYTTSINEVGHLSHAFLLKEYRGKGITKEAVKIIFNWFKEKGMKVAEVSVDSRNTEGVRAWEGLGFKEFTKKMKIDIN